MVVAVGGTNVKRANRQLTSVTNVGGSCRSMMRIAMVSPSGQDLRMVLAKCIALLAGKVESLIVLTSILRCACAQVAPSG